MSQQFIVAWSSGKHGKTQWRVDIGALDDALAKRSIADRMAKAEAIAAEHSAALANHRDRIAILEARERKSGQPRPF